MNIYASVALILSFMTTSCTDDTSFSNSSRSASKAQQSDLAENLEGDFIAPEQEAEIVEPAPKEEEIFDWVVRENAFKDGDGYVLTRATKNQKGLLVSKNKYPINKIILKFKFRMDQNGGSRGGADGITFAFTPLEMTEMNPRYGGSMGFAGVGGYGIELDTVKNDDHRDPNNNHIAIMRDGGGKPEHLKIATDLAFDLNGSEDGEIELTIDNGVVTVKLNDRVVIDSFQIPNFQPFEGHLVISSATGDSYSRHSVWDITQQIN